MLWQQTACVMRFLTESSSVNSLIVRARPGVSSGGRQKAANQFCAAAPRPSTNACRFRIRQRRLGQKSPETDGKRNHAIIWRV
jgi:hypothetical protein